MSYDNSCQTAGTYHLTRTRPAMDSTRENEMVLLPELL